MELTGKTAPAALARFGDFHDGVIRLIEIRPEDWTAQVELDAQDLEDAEHWVRVRLRFDGVAEWSLRQGPSDMVVIFRANAAEVDGVMFVGFDGPSASAPGAEDFRSTTAYIAARGVRLDVRPLSVA